MKIKTKHIKIIIFFIFAVSALVMSYLYLQKKLATNFLINIYTTNFEDRYSYFEMSDVSDGEAIDEYYRNINTMVSDDLYNHLLTNRVPMNYDKQNLDTPYAVNKVILKRTNKANEYKYSVEASNSDGEVVYLGKIRTSYGKIYYFYENSKKKLDE